MIRINLIASLKEEVKAKTSNQKIAEENTIEVVYDSEIVNDFINDNNFQLRKKCWVKNYLIVEGGVNKNLIIYKSKYSASKIYDSESDMFDEESDGNESEEEDRKAEIELLLNDRENYYMANEEGEGARAAEEMEVAEVQENNDIIHDEEEAARVAEVRGGEMEQEHLVEEVMEEYLVMGPHTEILRRQINRQLRYFTTYIKFNDDIQKMCFNPAPLEIICLFKILNAFQSFKKYSMLDSNQLYFLNFLLSKKYSETIFNFLFFIKLDDTEILISNRLKVKEFIEFLKRFPAIQFKLLHSHNIISIEKKS